MSFHKEHEFEELVTILKSLTEIVNNIVNQYGTLGHLKPKLDEIQTIWMRREIRNKNKAHGQIYFESNCEQCNQEDEK